MAEAESQTEEKKPRRMIWVIAALLVLAIAGGGAAWFFLGGTADGTVDPAEHAETEVFFGLESFLVNLANTEGRHYLRVGIDLGLGHEVEANEEELELLTALIRDTILSELATWESDPLMTPRGKTELKERLLHALENRVPELDVVQIYFNDFLVQR